MKLYLAHDFSFKCYDLYLKKASYVPTNAAIHHVIYFTCYFFVCFYFFLEYLLGYYV